jgi:hypothetical protein
MHGIQGVVAWLEESDFVRGRERPSQELQGVNKDFARLLLVLISQSAFGPIHTAFEPTEDCIDLFLTKLTLLSQISEN